MKELQTTSTVSSMPVTEKITDELDKYAMKIMNMEWLHELMRDKTNSQHSDAFTIFHDFAHMGARIVAAVKELETGQELKCFWNPLGDGNGLKLREWVKENEK